MLLSFAIIAYILSVVLALVFLFTSKNLNSGWFRMVASLHSIIAVVFIFNLTTNKTEEPHYLSFLVFVCTGVIGCGLAFGMKAMLPFRIYFSIFALSFALFLLSPSTLFRFLMTARLNNASEQPIAVKGNIYLEKESNAFNTVDQTLYKLIEKHGMFHQSISRDLNFKGKLDSIKILSVSSTSSINIRGYTSRKTYVSDEIDSTDVTVDLNPKKKDLIERKL